MNFRQAVKAFIPKKLFRKIEPYGHWLEAVAAESLAAFPARKLKVIGVTGTDGKSTTAYLMTQLLRQAGHKTALLSTVAVDYGDGVERPSPKHMTTAGVWEIVRLIKKIRSESAEWLVLETSSHALSQYRVWGIPYSLAIMTNLSHEHLDYHGTMDRYAGAKARLFRTTDRNRRGLRVGVINADDEYAPLFESSISKPVTYGLKAGEWRATEVKTTGNGLSFKAIHGEKSLNVKSKLSGEFNAYNLLAVIAAADTIGFSLSQIEAIIPKLEPAPGRMAKVDIAKPFSVFIDSAITANALEKVLGTARQIAGKGRVLLVFGATGDRDKTKRPEMGKVAASSADKVYLTDDETHNEDPESIRQAVFAGIEQAGGAGKAEMVAERREAIKKALGAARRGDVVLITGLGHQTTRNMGGRDMTWSDAEVVKSLLK